MVSKQHAHDHTTIKCRNGRGEQDDSDRNDMKAALSLSLPSTIRSHNSTALSIRLHILALLFIALFALVASMNHSHHSYDAHGDLRDMHSRKHRIDNYVSPYILPFLKLEDYYYSSEEEEEEFPTTTTMRTNSRSLFDSEEDTYISIGKDDNDKNDDNNDDNKSGINPANKTCRNYLRKFLSGTTDTHDECIALENAYRGSDCHSTESNPDNDSAASNNLFDSENNDGNNNDKPAIDDFFEEFECCQIITHYYSSKCLYHQRYASLSLLGVVSVLVLCSLTKTLLHSCTFISLQWLPEAGGCIIVGAVVSLIFRSLNASIGGKSSSSSKGGTDSDSDSHAG